MSADSWANCPRCKDTLVNNVIELEDELRESYGKVALSVYESMQHRLQEARKAAEDGHTGGGRNDTFREAYEFYGAETGTLTVSYHGQCTVCDLELSIEEQHPFYPAPMSTDFPGTRFGRGDTITVIPPDDGSQWK